MLIVVLVFSLVGILLTSFLTITHYTGMPSEACPKHIDGMSSCDIVNQSMYAELLGIPVALLGLFVYATFVILAYHILSGKPLFGFSSYQLHQGLAALSTISFLFALYLVYVLYFILKTVCVYCLASHSITASIFVLSTLSLLCVKK